MADGEPKANASTVEAAADRLCLNPDHANPFQEVFRADLFALAATVGAKRNSVRVTTVVLLSIVG